jgi:hypothetical protein
MQEEWLSTTRADANSHQESPVLKEDPRTRKHRATSFDRVLSRVLRSIGVFGPLRLWAGSALWRVGTLATAVNADVSFTQLGDDSDRTPARDFSVLRSLVEAFTFQASVLVTLFLLPAFQAGRFFNIYARVQTRFQSKQWRCSPDR